MKADGSEMITSVFASIFQSVKQALFPTKCYVCRSFFDHLASDTPSRSPSTNGVDEPLELSALFAKLMRPFLCPACIGNFLAVQSPICPQCGVMFAGREGADHVCGACLKRPRKFTRARSAGLYDGCLLSLIHAFKYHGRTELARPLGSLLYGLYRRHWADQTVDLIIPVPLHPRKQRRRGFNQAYQLTAGWGRHFDRQSGMTPVAIQADILRRVRWTAPQTGLGRQARHRNIKDAFAIHEKALVGNRWVLLVDDVFTTGATAGECARVLLAGGARQVDVLTLARTMRPSHD